jgi:hypothetical protein
MIFRAGLLALLGVVSMAQAQLATNGDWVYWPHTGNTAGIVGYNGPTGDVTIPPTIAGRTVTYVGSFIPTMFGEPNTSVTSVTISEGISAVSYAAFRSCSGLTNVNLPASVAVIDTMAFAGCSSLPSINIPSSVNHLGVAAFSNCWSLRGVNIPPAITNLNDYVFKNCWMAEATIGPNIKTLGRGVFSGTSLSEIVVPDNVTSVGAEAFQGCGLMTNASIGTGVVSIGNLAFANTALTGITLPFISAGRIVIATNAFPFPSSSIKYDFRSLANLNDFINALTQNEAFVAAVAERLKAGTNSYGLATKDDLVVTASNTVAQVQSDPNPYGLYSPAQYNENYGQGVVTGTALVTSQPEAYNLYTTNSIMDLAIGGLMVKKEGNVAKINFQTQTTTNLSIPFTNNGAPVTNEVAMPANKGFVRIQATHTR